MTGDQQSDAPRVISGSLLLDRLVRVQRQLDSFRTLHADDLSTVARDVQELGADAAGNAAQRLTALVDIQRGELELACAELADITSDLRSLLDLEVSGQEG